MLSVKKYFTKSQTLEMKGDESGNIRFIKEVEKYPQLYNNKLGDYNNRIQVDKIWTDIANKFGMSVESCKGKWKKLRSCYSRYVNKKREAETPYYLAEHLHFIREYTTSRDKAKDFDQTDDHEQLIDFMHVNASSPNEAIKQDTIEEDDILNGNHVFSPVSLSPRSGNLSPNPTTSSPHIKLNHLKREHNDVQGCAIEYFKVRKNQLKNQNNLKRTPKHPMELFLMSILPRAISLTEEQQSDFQVTVLNILHKIKFNQSPNNLQGSCTKQQNYHPS